MDHIPHLSHLRPAVVISFFNLYSHEKFQRVTTYLTINSHMEMPQHQYDMTLLFREKVNVA